MEIFNQSKVTITPDMASEMLQRNDINRKFTPPYVSFLAEQIKKGFWQYNGEPIIFGESGKLLDGQHRLMACVKSGCPIVADIKVGIPDKAFITIDDRKGRSNADVFYIENIPNATTMSSIIARIQSVFRGNVIMEGAVETRVHHSMNRAQMLAYYKQHKDTLTEVVNLTSRCYNKRRVLQKVQIGAYAAYLIIDKGWDLQTVENFFYQILGDNTENAILKALAKKLVDDAMSQRKMSPTLKQAYIIKAFNSFVSGKQGKTLSFRPGSEAMPEFLSNTILTNK